MLRLEDLVQFKRLSLPKKVTGAITFQACLSFLQVFCKLLALAISVPAYLTLIGKT